MIDKCFVRFYASQCVYVERLFGVIYLSVKRTYPALHSYCLIVCLFRRPAAIYR